MGMVVSIANEVTDELLSLKHDRIEFWLIMGVLNKCLSFVIDIILSFHRDLMDKK